MNCSIPRDRSKVSRGWAGAGGERKALVKAKREWDSAGAAAGSKEVGRCFDLQGAS